MRIGVVLTITGPLLLMLAISQLIPILVTLRHWEVYSVSAATSAAFGLTCILAGEKKIKYTSPAEIAFTVTLSWVGICILSSMPFLIHPLTNMNIANAIFEATSGITTTGSTVISDMSNIPKDILLWRAITQFIGGLGVIISIACAIFKTPITDMRIFAAESGNDNAVMPNHLRISTIMISSYLALIIICSITYYNCGMDNIIDAISYGISTISTGGLSNHNTSIGYFHSGSIEYASIIFMILGSCPLTMYAYFFSKKLRQQHHNKEEINCYLSIIIISSLAIAAWLIYRKIPLPNTQQSNWLVHAANAFRLSLFNVTATISTTGFSNVDYSLWGPFPTLVLLLLTFIGGCSHSTAGGIKVFRVIIIAKNIKHRIMSISKPNVVNITRLNGKPIDQGTTDITYNFFFLFLAIFLLVTIILTLDNIDHTTAISAAVGSLGNVGPGIGLFTGPAGNYAELNDLSKYTLSAAMITGRLEIFSIVILFLPNTWSFARRSYNLMANKTPAEVRQDGE